MEDSRRCARWKKIGWQKDCRYHIRVGWKDSGPRRCHCHSAWHPCLLHEQFGPRDDDPWCILVSQSMPWKQTSIAIMSIANACLNSPWFASDCHKTRPRDKSSQGRRTMPLRVGSACSGWGSELLALRLLGINYESASFAVSRVTLRLLKFSLIFDRPLRCFLLWRWFFLQNTSSGIALKLYKLWERVWRRVHSKPRSRLICCRLSLSAIFLCWKESWNLRSQRHSHL